MVDCDDMEGSFVHCKQFGTGTGRRQHISDESFSKM